MTRDSLTDIWRSWFRGHTLRGLGDGAPATVGVSGHGFKHAPVIGQIVADLVCDGRSRTWDIAPFSSRRFADGRSPWRGLYRYWAS